MSGVELPLTPVIMAGGGGTRLWPLSRQHYPKQFLTLTGANSLLQDTLTRAVVDTATAPIVICNEDHRFLVAEQMRQIEIAPERLVLEPVGRNTAPALTIAALEAQHRHGDAVLAMMPADHIIPDLQRFQEALRRAAGLAADGFLVALGITPERAETGYGYIKVGAQIAGKQANLLDRFVEKPQQATAQEYLRAGDYVWNSGIFVMTASQWLKAIGECQPAILNGCRDAYAKAEADGVFIRPETAAFSECPADSVDYAVMERVGDGLSVPGAVVAFAGSWSDVGSWSGLWDVSDKDDAANVLRGDVLCQNATGNLVLAEQRFVALAGCEDLVVIETADAVLIAPKSKSQDVKQIVAWLAAEGRDERLTHSKVHRPWGSYQSVDVGDRHQVKRIIVNPGEQLSLQMHRHRAEHWIVVKGTALVTLGDEEFMLDENESTYIPSGTKHRLANPTETPLEIVEVQSGSYLGEDDIVRYDDKYDRHKAPV